MAAAVGLALAVGVALGAIAFSGSGASRAAGAVPSDLTVVSTWSGHPWKGATTTVTVESGSLEGSPGHGFVLVETPGGPTAFFAAPTATGAFRMVSHTDSGWELRSGDGSLVLVSPSTPDGPATPTITFLGRALSPAHLGSIGKSGIAVPVVYGNWSLKKKRYTDSAVVLVEQTKGGQWKLAGYLPGFSIPRPSPLQPKLKRPLVGPDGRAYSVDANDGRLVRDTAWHASTAPGSPPMYKLGTCTSWPASGGGSYRACPNSIVLDRSGASTTLFRRNLGGQMKAWGWYFLQPSPDGKWLMLEDAMGACGTATWVDFLPANGGRLLPGFPGPYVSEALGWLPGDTALIAAHSNDSCGPEQSGIYEVVVGEAPTGDPNSGQGSWLVFAGDVSDATTWGFGS